MRKALITLVLSLVVFAPTFAAPVAHHALPADCWQVGVVASGNSLWECAPEATATPTATGEPTATPGPTQTPPPTSTPSVGVPPFAGAPLCGGHNNRLYHGLWNEVDACHFDHHHGDNPHDADEALGVEIYSVMGGEISYPWQTFSAAGIENDLKHAGYFWHVRTDMPCDTTPCITDFRALVHQHPSGRDAAVRYHSYVFEARTSDGGYIFFGGWVDFGDLHSPEGNIVIDEPDNHDNPACGGAGRHKQHSPSGAPQIIWYGASQQTHGECGPRGFVTLSTSIHDVWDYTSPANPSDYSDYVCYGAPRCTANATLLRAHLIGVNMVGRWPFIYDSAGLANWTGYANRYGELLEDSACTAATVDCVPVVFRNLRRGQVYGAANAHTALDYREYDVVGPDGRTYGWSQPVP